MFRCLASPWRARRLLGLLAACLACSGAGKRATNPENAFRQLRDATASHYAGDIYDCLDLDSQWSIQTLHRSENELARLAKIDATTASGDDTKESSRRLAERYAAATHSGSPRNYFSSLQLHGQLAAPLGTVTKREPQPDGSIVYVTDKNLRLLFATGSDGRWGFAGWRAELARRKDHAINALSLMQRSKTAVP